MATGHSRAGHISLLKFYLFFEICNSAHPTGCYTQSSAASHKFVVAFKYQLSTFALVLCAHLQVIKILSVFFRTRTSIPYQRRSLLASLALHWPCLPFVPEMLSWWTGSSLTPEHSAFYPEIHAVSHFFHSLSSRPVFLYPVWLSRYSLISFHSSVFMLTFFFFLLIYCLMAFITSGYRIIYPLCLLSSRLNFTQCYLYFPLILLCCNLTFHYYYYQQSVIYRAEK